MISLSCTRSNNITLSGLQRGEGSDDERIGDYSRKKKKSLRVIGGGEDTMVGVQVAMVEREESYGTGASNMILSALYFWAVTVCSLDG